ncbi:ubiquitin carboxyl-terminal hydrolase 43a isoform X1 [Rhincodon typus]|uniref:ubiquitin carboxyl-terminal hydrolase 43a isoform X1 n=1 Tax=Rhincodon typus TaxID=259920 RepID=UPI00202F967A|nr:ubiquitin carboxyl-terminal hydrolase 43a isoform X1 [Rhincodon typus]
MDSTAPARSTLKGHMNKGKRRKSFSGKLFRRRSLRSVGSFVRGVFKTLITLAPFGEASPDGDGGGGGREQLEEEEDDGGFRVGTVTLATCSENREEEEARVKSLSLARRRERLPGDKPPGVLGLKNHGNTCFMNAVVQCLSNTELFAEYLGLEQYRSELKQLRANGTLRSKEPPSQCKAEVTEQLAALVRALWTLEYTPQLSVQFKNIVAKYGSQFRGNSQHDALEFLLWLLNRVHEDLNCSPNKKSKPSIKPSNVGGETCAGSQQNSQQVGIQSFVQELFQAQYRSSLTCPHCLKQSNTFDPFLCISLPIPLRQTRALNVTLVFQSKHQKYLRIGLAIPLLGTVAALRKMVADEGNITPDQIILTEVYTNGFERSFSDEEDLNVIAEGDCVYAFQAPSVRGNCVGTTRQSGRHQNVTASSYKAASDSFEATPVEFVQHGATGKVLLLICNSAGTGQQAVRFGPPFLVREDRTLTWDQLQFCILNKMCCLMRNETHWQNFGHLFRIRVVGGLTTNCYLSSQDIRPLCQPAIDRALRSCGLGGPPHIKLVLEWDQKAKDSLFGNIQEEVVQDGESVRIQQQAHQQAHSCTLAECFELYTKEEQLAPDDAWRCPHCKNLQQGMVKLNLWTLPDILIIHLKRFRQMGERRTKLSTLVKFPQSGLDMTPHVAKRTQNTKNFLSHWSPWRRPRFPSGSNQENYLYDLYAVCNHHGSMQGGHYTAYCRNSVDGQWYDYDDSNAELIPEEEVCTRGAYILFYQKRNTIPPWSANSSVAGSISSSISDHWLNRLTGDSKRGSLVSQASTNCTSLPSSPDSPVFPDNPKKDKNGGFEIRPIVRGIQGRSISMKGSATPSVPKNTTGKNATLRWSLGAKDRPQSIPGALVEYLESGRRPKCTKESIVPIMTGSTDPDSLPPTDKPKQSNSDGHSDCKKQTGKGSAVDQSMAFTASRIGDTSVERMYDSSNSLRSTHHKENSVDEKTNTLKRNGKQRGSGGTFQRKSSKTATDKSEVVLQKTEEPIHPKDDRICSSTGGQSIGSMSSLALSDTLKRKKGHHGGKKLEKSLSLRSTDLEPMSSPNLREADKGSKAGETKLSERKFAFLRTNFLKKDSKRQSESEKWAAETVNTSSSISLSNGAVNGKHTGESLSESRAQPGVNGTKNCAKNRQELNNGKINISGEEIRRSQSSSNILIKEELTLKRSSSLQKTGPNTQQARNINVERYATLQRMRYSTSSLGRKKPVPESSF